MIQVFEGTGNEPGLIVSISGGMPHESYGSWENFLKLGRCEIRDEVDGVVYYGHVNCNYLLFPNGVISESYGMRGEVLMAEVRDRGWEAVYKKEVSDWELAERNAD